MTTTLYPPMGYADNAPDTTDALLVVKIGGGAGLDLSLCMDDVAALSRARPVVVVHGVSAHMDALCAAHGVPIRTLTSPDGHQSRYTDAATRDLFVLAAHEVNAEIVNCLRARGVAAAGITEAYAVHGRRKDAIRAVVNGRMRMIRDDYSGTVTHVDTAPLHDLLTRGTVAVLPPLAFSPDGALNVDGDRLSAAVAAALGAHDLVILSNVRGLLRDPGDPASLVSLVSRDQTEAALGWAQGRMKRKVLGAVEALNAGVGRVLIADGRAAQPLRSALAGAGTEFRL